ncbi:MAG: hypothetical protein ACTH9T_04815 [Mycetocola reblochoni]|uniref:hypothetical protein n=1 Tax=Mycetocola reblochoni TaxID=331618 RepID=UPI003F975B25
MTVSSIVYAAAARFPDGETLPLQVIDGRVTVDDSWAPYVQAEVVIPRPDPATYARLDPEDALIRVHVRAVQSYGDPVPVSLLSSLWSDVRLAGLTARYGDDVTVAGLTAEVARPYNDEGIRPSARQSFMLTLRARHLSAAEGKVTLTLAGDEARAMDYGLVDSSPEMTGTTSVRGAVRLVLERIGAPLAPGTADAAIEDIDAATWEPGMSGWDWVSPLVEAANMRLWADFQGLWHLDPLDDLYRPGANQLVEFVQVEDEVARDDDYYDAVVVVYRWTSGDTDKVAYDTASNGTGTKTLTIERDTPWPGSGAARGILDRMKAQRITLETVANLAQLPRTTVRVAAPDLPEYVGHVRSVAWEFGTDRSVITTRNLTKLHPAAWLLEPAGQRWNDLPTGSAWTADYNPGGTE